MDDNENEFDDESVLSENTSDDGSDVDVDVDADADVDEAQEEETHEEDDDDVDDDLVGNIEVDDDDVDAHEYNATGGGSDDDEDDDIEGSDSYLQKFNEEIRKNYIADFHPECVINNYDEVRDLTVVIRDKAGNVIDDLHKTIPYLTKYERTRIIGQRAKQINSGAKAFVKVPETVIDGYLIAEMELIQKKIPFIVRRPTPSGGCEYWNLKDLEVISF
jgi:DNA-directed RNA polymerase subunit K/omega